MCIRDSCLTIQAFQEAVHSQSYGYMLDTICSPVERNEILYQWRQDEHLLRRNEFIGNLYNEFQEKKDDYTLVRTMIANYILEDVYKRQTEQGSEGLLHNKKVTLVVSSGGVTSGTQPKETCTAIAWLKNLFLVCGICDVQVIYCEGIEQMPNQAEIIITTAIQHAKHQGAVWDTKAGE